MARGTKQLDERVKINKERWDSNVGSVRLRFEDWMNNISFYLGYQYQCYDSSMYGYFYPPFRDETLSFMAQSNLIKPLADARISQYIANRPKLQVISQDKSPESILQAEKESNVLNALWQNYNIGSFLNDVARWMVVCNQPFVRCSWNPEAGSAVENPAYSDEFTPEEPSTFVTGELDIELIPGFNLLYSPFYRTFDENRRYGWVSIKTIQTRGNLKRLFPDKINIIDKFDNESVVSVSDPEDAALRREDFASYEMRTNSSEADRDNHTMTTYENYDASDKSHMVIVQNEILFDNKYKTKKIPIIAFQDMPGMMSGTGKSLVSMSRQHQKIYNIMYSRMLEYSLLPTLYILPRDPGFEETSLMDSVYQIVSVDDWEAKPQILSPGTLPEQQFFILNDCKQYLEHLWGMHEVSMRGTTPNNQRLSGRGIYLLQGKDEQRHAASMIYWEDSLRDLGELMLELTHLNSKDEQSLSFSGEDGRNYQVSFTGEDITGNGKISVEVSSDFAENKQALQQFIKDILQVSPNLPALQKYLNDPVVIYKLISFINDKLANVLMHDNKDAATAQRENRMFMESGQIAEVEFWHNHSEHLIQHLDMMNSPEYESLPVQAKQMWQQNHFIKHIQMAQGIAQQGMDQANPQQRQQQEQPPEGVYAEQPQSDNPLYNIDQTIEGMVNPSGQPGMEETP